MSFDDLLRARVIERVEVTPEEIAGLFAVARRDIRTAQHLVSADLDWAFAIAYNSILQLSIAYMNYLGFRPRGEGKHFNTFRFLEKALPEEQTMVRRLQKLRKKRNVTIYEHAGSVSEKEARDVIEFAVRYYKHIESKLPDEITALGEKEEDR
ncbi:MAG: hypothetical protein M5U22_07075 [Thermoleophilia bacterium]|nr:hypothetical protein [Thermoleophilia bacterium]